MSFQNITLECFRLEYLFSDARIASLIGENKEPDIIDFLYSNSEFVNRIQNEMYEMVDDHFDEKKNYNGESWQENTNLTYLLKVVMGITKINPLVESIKDPNPLIGSGDYKREITTRKTDNLNFVKKQDGNLVFSLGSDSPKTIHEFAHRIRSGFFRGKSVPKRSVLHFDDETVDSVLDIVEENVILFYGGK